MGSGGPNPCGDSVKKMSAHFLSLINGWIWDNWGLGAQIHIKDSIKKMSTHFLSLGWENEYSYS